jgi:hypothetical protein
MKRIEARRWLAALLATPLMAHAGCGEFVQIEAAGGHTRYALVRPEPSDAPAATLLLPVGGGGALDLDALGRRAGAFGMRAQGGAFANAPDSLCP